MTCNRMIHPSIRRWGATAIVLVAVIVAAMAGTASAQLPTVRFAWSQYSVHEANTDAPIALVISTPPDVQTWVGVDLTPGTATVGDDFVGGNTVAIFETAGPDTAYAYVQIYNDPDVEGPETILLSISPNPAYYEVGEPSTATLTIIDDDSETPIAHFEYAEDVPVDPWGRLNLAMLPGNTVPVDVVIDFLPPGGTTVYYSSTADGQIHPVVFDSGTRQTIELPAPEIPGGAAYATNDLRLLNPAGKNSIGMWIDLIVFSAATGDPECVACSYAFLYITVLHADCGIIRELCPEAPCITSAAGPSPPGRSAKLLDLASDLATLRDYRDQVLLPSGAGDYYVQLYQDLSPDIATAILQRPALVYRVAATWEQWLPAVAAVVAGQGDSFTITTEMQTNLLNIMTEFQEVGSSTLANYMTQFRAALDLDHIAGQSAATMQSLIESNPMDAEPASWGKLKTLYR